MAERARDFDPDVYAAAIEAKVGPATARSDFHVRAEILCGDDRIHAGYRSDDVLELEVTPKDTLAASMVEVRLAGRVAYRSSSRPEDGTSYTFREGEQLSRPATQWIEKIGRFLPDGDTVPAVFTVACAYRWGAALFKWGERRTLRGVTLRLQRPDAAAIGRVLARRRERGRLNAEEFRLSEGSRPLRLVADEARKWDSPTARRIVQEYDRRRADLDRRTAEFEATSAARDDFAGVITLSGPGCPLH